MVWQSSHPIEAGIAIPGLQAASILAAPANTANPAGAATAREAALVVTVPELDVEAELLLLPDPPLTFWVMKLTADVPLSWTYERCTVMFWPESQNLSPELQNETILFITAAQPELSVRGKTCATAGQSSFTLPFGNFADLPLLDLGDSPHSSSPFPGQMVG